MDDGIKRVAAEIAPDLDRLIDKAGYIGDPEDRDNLVTFLWNNKIGILRVLQAVAALNK